MDMNARPAQADALYGNSGNQQIGLSILRVRIDPAADPTRANWATEVGNAQQASSRGAIVFATPWSPPAAMKTSLPDPTNPLWGGSLDPASYADYANYLESFVTYMHDNGVDLYAISMQNEPDFLPAGPPGYDSCLWTPDQMHAWVLNNSSVLTTRLIMPESAGFNTSYSDPTLDDANVGQTPLAIIGGHLYGSSPAAYANALGRGMDLWMTEHAMTNTGIQGALNLAKEIHDSITVGGYNAYVYWWLQNWNGGNYGYGLIDDPAQDNILTPIGYAMGQFSKFIRPGYVRVTATNNPSGSVYVSAYKGNGHFVIVALNLGTSSVIQPFVIQNQSIRSVTPYRTSATENLSQGNAISIVNGSFTYALPAGSITTFAD